MHRLPLGAQLVRRFYGSKINLAAACEQLHAHTHTRTRWVGLKLL